MHIYYGTCNACNKNSVPWQMPLQGRSNEDVRFPQWVLKKVQCTDKACPSSATGEVTITAKEVITSTIDELMDKFTNDIHQVKKHVFVIRHQFRVYRTLREIRPPESCMIHVDFSENFVGKYATEIQAVHFSGSPQQMTLHTGVLYLKNQTIPFCTISPSTQHDPPAIWAHLTQILQMIRSHPDVKTLHVFTDGPLPNTGRRGTSTPCQQDRSTSASTQYHGISSSQGTTRAHQMALAGRLSEQQTAKLNWERISRTPKCCMIFCRKQHPFNCFTSEQRKLQRLHPKCPL